MSTSENVRTPDTLVTGATGFIGRWLLPELTRHGRCVAALVRNAESRRTELECWVAGHGGDPTLLVVLDGDVEKPDLGLESTSRQALAGVCDVFHLAANYAFGLDPARSRAANLDAAVTAVGVAAGFDDVRRFVHLGGYRVAHHAEAGRLDSAGVDHLYRRNGAYEAAKIEAHHAVRDAAAAQHVELTIINPSSVIGDSRTGETTQLEGLGSVVRDLATGRLPAMVGSRSTFVPVVPVDYLVSFMAAVPHHLDTAGASYYVLDEETPTLPHLLRHIADRLGVRAPRLTVPVGLVRRLPRSITKVEPEALSFIASDRYPTGAARRFADSIGLAMPDTLEVIDRWVDYLFETDFLTSAVRPAA